MRILLIEDDKQAAAYLVKGLDEARLQCRARPRRPGRTLCRHSEPFDLVIVDPILPGLDGRRIELQPREFRLLEHLMRHAGQVVTRTMLLEAVWDYHFDPQTNVIDIQSTYI